MGDKEHNCQEKASKCLHCPEYHPTFHHSCIRMRTNKEVNAILAHSDISVYEARTMAKNKLGIPTQINRNKDSIQNTNTDKSFPKLLANSPNKTFQLRQIGGIIQDSKNQSNPWLINNTLKTYSRNSPPGIVIATRSLSIESLNTNRQNFTITAAPTQNSLPKNKQQIKTNTKQAVTPTTSSQTASEKPTKLNKTQSIQFQLIHKPKKNAKPTAM